MKNDLLTNKWHVYILKCANGTYYTGCTGDLAARLDKHNNGGSSYTKPYRPLTLVTFITFTDKYKAYAFERYLKSGSGHAFARKRLV